MPAGKGYGVGVKKIQKFGKATVAGKKMAKGSGRKAKASQFSKLKAGAKPKAYNPLQKARQDKAKKAAKGFKLRGTK